MNTNKWFDLMNKAHEILLTGQEFDTYKPNIQIAVEHSHANCFFLQISINEENVNWYRTTWLRLTDAPKFSNPIEEIKYVGQVIEPTMKFEYGIMPKESIQEIIDFTRSLTVKPQLDKWDGIIIGGTSYTLMVGVESTQMTFKWHHLPDGWESLQTLACMLETLNENL